MMSVVVFLSSLEGLCDEGVASGWYCIVLAEGDEYFLKAQENLISCKSRASSLEQL